jgi:hypothetical protein
MKIKERKTPPREPIISSKWLMVNSLEGEQEPTKVKSGEEASIDKGNIPPVSTSRNLMTKCAYTNYVIHLAT